MASEINLTLTLGDTWVIPFELNDAAGDNLDLTGGGQVKFRLSRRRVLFMELTTDGADIEVESPSNGNGTITVTPEDQAAAGLFAAVYQAEVRAIPLGGVVTTQAAGAITVEPSLFA